MKILIPLVCLLLLATGACRKPAGSVEHVYWVNSQKVPCEEAGPAQCLQVQKGDTLDPAAWKTFPGSMEGFAYEPGFVYKLLVRETERENRDLPAADSSLGYTLVKVLEKDKDPRLALQHSWILESLNGKTMEVASGLEYGERPRLEFQLVEMTYGGTDGCNRIFGSILELDAEILRFGMGAGTRMMCPDMEVPDEFNRTLARVFSYELSDLRLQLFDEEGDQVMQFQKAGS